jgi:hypothetical protein
MGLELRDVGGLTGSPVREDELQARLAALRLHELDAVSSLVGRGRAGGLLGCLRRW